MTADSRADVETSEWQKRIEGEWHGRPGLFDAEGNHVGFERVDRASVVEDGVARYWMNTSLEARGPLRNRFELGAQFDFGIVDSDENRVYCGPDFYGTGQPYGLFVDAHYYSPGWQADLRTWNQVLPDGETQVYSSVLHDGWAVCAVFNGIYKRTFDHETNPETQKFVDDWIALETQRGSRPQVLPTKEKGAWTGELFVERRRPERRRRGRRSPSSTSRSRCAVRASRSPGRGDARAQLHLRAGPRRCPHAVRGPGGLRQRDVLRPRALHHASTSSAPTRAAWRRSRAARS